MIDCLIRITCDIPTLIDHILTNTQGTISRSGVINTAISDHFLIYCTRRMKAKHNGHKKITFRSLKNYLADVYKGTLERVSFPNYESFNNSDIAYNDFITSSSCIMKKRHRIQTAHITNKSAKLHVNEKIYKEARNTVQNLIQKKRKAYFEEKIKEDTANRQNIWKTLKQLPKVTLHWCLSK